MIDLSAAIAEGPSDAGAAQSNTAQPAAAAAAAATAPAPSIGAGVDDRLFLRMLEDLDSLSEVQLRLLFQTVRRTCQRRNLRLIIAHNIYVQTDVPPVAPGAQGGADGTTPSTTADIQIKTMVHRMRALLQMPHLVPRATLGEIDLEG